MSLTFTYGGVDLGTDTIRLGSLNGFQEGADNGNYSTSGIEVDDPDGSLDLVGLKKFEVEESACSEPRLFSGYAALRKVARSQTMVAGAARLWSVDLLDLNAIFGQRLLLSNASNRPAETDIARIGWLIANGWTPDLHDNGLIDTSSPVNMDAADYRGRYAADVLGDCVGARENRIYFPYWDSMAGEASLAYIDPTGTDFSSSLRFTNDIDDVDGVTTFFANGELTRDPSEVYSTVWIRASNLFATATDAATAAAFIPRDVAVDAPQIGKILTAQHYANKLVAQDNHEQDTIVVTCWLPADSVNLVRAGQRVQVKFSHLPGYSSGYTYVRTVRRTVAQDHLTQDWYSLTLELSTSRTSGATGGSPNNTTVWPSQQPPFVPQGAADYKEMVRADGAIHAWAFDSADAAGSTVADYIDSDPGATTTTGSNPTTIAGPSSISSGANNWRLQRTDSHGTVIVESSTRAADWPQGNSSWTVEWWGDYITTFLDSAFKMLWGDLHTTGIEVGGSPTSLTPHVQTGLSVSDTSGSRDLSAYTSTGWHYFAYSYDGATRLFTMNVDGVDRWTGTLSADASIDLPNPPLGTTSDAIFQFVALQEYGHGWEAIYPNALSSTQKTNHSLGDAGAANTNSTVPSPGQPIAPESAVGDGSTTAYTTAYPYVPGSLAVQVGGVPTVVTETDPATGVFTLPAAPASGVVITWTYHAADNVPTGAHNPPPTPAAAFIPDAAIATGTPSMGDVPISDGAGSRAWGPMSGGGGGNLDGGTASSTYGAISPVDGGNA